MPSTSEMGHEESMERKDALARELAESGEAFPFPGIPEDTVTRMREEEAMCPGFMTNIDDIIRRCSEHGIVVALSSADRPNNSTPHVMPAKDGNLRMDGILPKHLVAENIADERLRELVMLDGIRE